MTPHPQHKTMRDQLKEKLEELSVKSSRFGISHSMTIGHIIDDIEQITGIVDDSWMGVPWTEFLTCDQEAEVMEGRKAIDELKELRSRPHTPAPDKEVLELLKKKVAWGKEIDRNHLFDYHSIEKMIDEAEERVKSLREQQP